MEIWNCGCGIGERLKFGKWNYGKWNRRNVGSVIVEWYGVAAMWSIVILKLWKFGMVEVVELCGRVNMELRRCGIEWGYANVELWECGDLWISELWKCVVSCGSFELGKCVVVEI